VRRFRTNSRRRRFSAPGRAPGGRKKVWINKTFSALGTPVLGILEFADIFELVAAEDYTDPTSTTQKIEYATVVRSVGQVQCDLIIEAPGANGILWSAAVFVRSQTAVLAEFSAAPTGVLFFIHPESPSTTAQSEHLARLQPLHWVPWRSYSAAFRPNPGGQCSEFFADVNLPPEALPYKWDITQRRRMRTDESLWLVVSGIFICPVGGENSPVVNTVMSRTLIHDD